MADRQPKQTGRPIEWTKDKIECVAKELEAWFHADELNMFYKGFFARRPDVHPDLISKFSSVNDVFRETIKKLEILQQERLIRHGSARGQNPAMHIFLLKANHGYKDVQHVEATQDITTKDTTTQLRALSETELKEKVRAITEQRSRRG